jgi:hypothetical protein
MKESTRSARKTETVIPSEDSRVFVFLREAKARVTVEGSLFEWQIAVLSPFGQNAAGSSQGLQDCLAMNAPIREEWCREITEASPCTSQTC